MCKLFKINAQQDFQKLVTFLVSSEYFIYRTCTRISTRRETRINFV